MKAHTHTQTFARGSVPVDGVAGLAGKGKLTHRVL